MKFKKIVSTALAGAMALSLATTAFATPNVTGSDPTNVEVTGTTEVPQIKVTVNTTAAVVVNPYQLTVTPAGGSAVRDQIISAPVFIKSETNAALNVSAAVTGKKEGNAVFATSSTQAGKAVSTNSVFMYMEIQEAEDGTTEPTWEVSYDKGNVNQLLVGETQAASKGAMLTMPEGKSAATFAAFSLRGDAADKPTTPWAATDKVSATIALTFTPVMDEKYDITIDPSITGGNVTASVSKTFAGEEVTLEIVPTDNTMKAAVFTVEDADGAAVTVTQGSNKLTGTFTMPEGPVTVKSVTLSAS